jgi:hypothetical protein
MSIDGLVARFVLEPELRSDIFVEGVDDQRIIVWLLESCGKARSVMPIEMIEVPDGDVASLGYPTGCNRSRVITLAHLILARTGLPHAGTFVIDRDLEDLVPTGREARPLSVVVTEFGALDIYLFHTDAVGKLLRRFGRDEKPVDFKKVVFDILSEIYLLRASVAACELPVRILDFQGDLTSDRNRIVFDFEAYLTRCLNASKFYGKRVEVRARIDLFRGQTAELRLQAESMANGHDLMDLLAWIIRRVFKAGIWNEDSIRGLLFMALNKRILLKSPVLLALVS